MAGLRQMNCTSDLLNMYELLARIAANTAYQRTRGTMTGRGVTHRSNVRRLMARRLAIDMYTCIELIDWEHGQNVGLIITNLNVARCPQDGTNALCTINQEFQAPGLINFQILTVFSCEYIDEIESLFISSHLG